MSRAMPFMVAILLAAVFAGCLGVEDPATGNTKDTVDRVPALFAWQQERLEIEVTVPVVLVGFPEEAADALRTALDPMTVVHGTSDLNQVYPVDPSAPDDSLPLLGRSFDISVVPTAMYEVVQAPDALVDLVKANLSANQVGERGDTAIYDADAMEALLAAQLPLHGIEVDPGAPSIVVLHLDALDGGQHAWRYTMPHGYLEPVRVFGEKEPLLVLDPSAQPDPYVGPYQEGNEATGSTPRYYSPTEVDDTETIARFVQDATHFRILQGTVYPSPTAPCHAMTFIYAIRDTALTNHLPGYDLTALYHPDEQLRAFSNLTGTDNVFLDSKILRLPVDDPALDAIARGDFATFEAQRTWLHQNWADYWVPHDGCEAYVSLVVYTDSATPTAGGGVIGIGTYDESKSYRIALSWVPEPFHLTEGYSGAGEDHVNNADPSLDRFQWVDYLHAHEAGHTIGQRHPHDVNADGVSGVQAFSSVWSAMSYQTDGRVIDFGAVDHNNFVRNRLAFLLQEAVAADLVDSPEWKEALHHASLYHWQVAGDVLSEALGKPVQTGGTLTLHE